MNQTSTYAINIKQASIKSKAQINVVRLSKFAFEVIGPMYVDRLRGPRKVVNCTSYESALATARIWRLNIALNFMGVQKNKINEICNKYALTKQSELPQFNQLIKEAIELCNI